MDEEKDDPKGPEVDNILLTDRPGLCSANIAQPLHHRAGTRTCIISSQSLEKH